MENKEQKIIKERLLWQEYDISVTFLNKIALLTQSIKKKKHRIYDPALNLCSSERMRKIKQYENMLERIQKLRLAWGLRKMQKHL